MFSGVAAMVPGVPHSKFCKTQPDKDNPDGSLRHLLIKGTILMSRCGESAVRWNVFGSPVADGRLHVYTECRVYLIDIPESPRWCPGCHGLPHRMLMSVAKQNKGKFG